MLDATPIRAFSDNYIWMIHGLRDRTQVAVVDPGDAAPVVDTLESQGLKLGAILVTHHHYDHVGGVAALRRRYGAEVIGPAARRYRNARAASGAANASRSRRWARSSRCWTFPAIRAGTSRTSAPLAPRSGERAGVRDDRV